MRISVFGIGYVGSVSAACTSQQGHSVVAVDSDENKVRAINAGTSPIVEHGLAELIAEQVREGRLTATVNARRAILETELSFICVGTPSSESDDISLAQIARVCTEIGDSIRRKDERHTVIVRSTMLPGSMENVVINLIEKHSGLVAGDGFGVGIYPEFLRESQAIADFNNPSTIVAGCIDDQTAEILQLLAEEYECEKHFVDIRTAEMVKYCANAWHASKISFANEIGWLCKNLDIDGQEVLDVVCSETRLNISRLYMKPGFAFGGSCLPKDLRALRHKARHQDVSTPVLDAIMLANERQIDRAVKLIVRSGNRRVGMLGLAFKAGTDDLRESPLVTLAERLIGKGYDVKIYDRAVSSSMNQGNSRTVDREMPHLAAALVNELDHLIECSDTIVVGTEDDEFRKLNGQIRPEHTIVDLVRSDPGLSERCHYEGICW